ncbi:hypothetical protein QTP88_003452 [Uroleucon formosanum]
MFDNKCVEHTESSIAERGKKSNHSRCVPMPKRLFLVLYKEIVVLVGNTQQDLTGYTLFDLTFILQEAFLSTTVRSNLIGRSHLNILGADHDITPNGSKFMCSEVIAPVKSEVDDICLYIINFEDLTSPPSPVEQPDPASRLSKFDRARQSFRQSLRMSSFRGRNARQSGRLTPLPHEDEYDEESSSTHLKTPSTPKAPDSLSLKTAVADSVITSTTTARVEDETTSPRHLFIRPEHQISQPHRTPDPPSPPLTPNKSPERNPSFGGSPPARSNTDSVLASRVEKDQLQRPKRPHTIDIITEAYRSHFTGKSFPNTSSETDLQKYNTSTLWDHSTSLGNLATDSLKYKYSIQDNGSAKFFQGALHTPNMGEKVAQIWSARDLFVRSKIHFELISIMLPRSILDIEVCHVYCTLLD